MGRLASAEDERLGRRRTDSKDKTQDTADDQQGCDHGHLLEQQHAVAA
jgi:hypothetical protein